MQVAVAAMMSSCFRAVLTASPLPAHLPPSRPPCLSHTPAASASKLSVSAQQPDKHAAGERVQWAGEPEVSAGETDTAGEAGRTRRGRRSDRVVFSSIRSGNQSIAVAEFVSSSLEVVGVVMVVVGIVFVAVVV